MPMDPSLAARARAWLVDDPDPETREELAALLDAEDEAAIADRFHSRLGFGTAGIRGEMGAGPNRMNLAVVRATVAGIATWLGPEQRDVVIGRDGRRNSRAFAEDAGRVLAGAGIPALVLPGPVPTPALAFAVRHLGAGAGIMITASHNPPADNGIKVYGDDGAQIVPPTDGEIAAAIGHLGPVLAIPLDDAGVRHLGPEVLDAYVERAARAVADGPRNIRAVHTAMHGVGWEPLRRVFTTAGFPEPVPVPEQAEPNATFPTVSFPNPEEPGALDLALALARREQVDLVLANDPDADRLAVAVRDGDDWRQLTGDEVGVLLGDHVLATTTGDDRLVACSVVSSSMLGRMAVAADVHFVATLTGFKWIVRAVDHVPGSRFVFGYEEALGYAIGDLVRDKDGITAALAFTDLAARLKANGETVMQRLEQLARRHGLHATRQWSIRAPVPDIQAAVSRIITNPPPSLAGRGVRSIERPADDVVVLRLDGDTRVIVRPSGTEPKLKTYFQVVLDEIAPGDAGWQAAQADAAAQLEALRCDIAGVLGLGARPERPSEREE